MFLALTIDRYSFPVIFNSPINISQYAFSSTFYKHKHLYIRLEFYHFLLVSQCNVLIPIHVYKITFSKSLLSYTPHTNLAKCLPLRAIYTFLGLLPSFGKCQSTIWFCTSRKFLKINLTRTLLYLNENNSFTVYFLIDYSFSWKAGFCFWGCLRDLVGRFF